MRFLIAFTSLMLLLVGCTSPKSTYYTLNPTPISQLTSGAKELRVMVGPVTLPAQVDRPQLVLQDGDNEVQVYEYRRWAGSLKGDASNVIASNLAKERQISNVWNFSQSTQTNFDYQVLIDVQSLDSRSGDRVVLDVLWTIKPASKSQSGSKTQARNPDLEVKSKAIMGRSLVREPVTDSGFDALVAAQSRAFAKVGREIAQSIP